MGKFRKLLEKDWLKYGFETFAVLVGVLGAFALENWQITIIDEQSEFEKSMRSTCEDLISALNHTPDELDKIEKLASSLSRKTFIVYNPVFEDLKYSGRLSLLSRTQLRNAILGFYQLAEYVELVLAKNNATYADAVTLYLIDNGLTDFGDVVDSLNVASMDFSLDAESHSGPEEEKFFCSY